MLDKKIKVAFGNVSPTEIEFKGQTVKVKPFLSIDDQEVLRSTYMMEYFQESESHVLNAEYSLLAVMLELCTDIQLTEEREGKEHPLLHVDDLLTNYGFLKVLRNSILNYSDFRALLRQSLDDEKEKRKDEYSIGKVLSDISDKAINALNAILEFDASDEALDKLREATKDIEGSPILQEAIKIFKERSNDEEKAE